jgi:hypothetical protein
VLQSGAVQDGLLLMVKSRIVVFAVDTASFPFSFSIPRALEHFETHKLKNVRVTIHKTE